MDVTGEYRRESGGDGAAGNYVPPPTEREIGRADSGPFHRLVQAEEPDIRLHIAPCCSIHQVGKTRSKITAVKWETGERYTPAARADNYRSGMVDDMQPRQPPDQRKRERRPLVVSRHHDNRYALLRNRPDEIERPESDPGAYPGAVKEIAAMDDQVDFTLPCRTERQLEIPEEIFTSPPPPDARTNGCVEAEVSVGQEQDPDRAAGTLYRFSFHH